MILIILILIVILAFYLLAKICDRYFIPSLDQISNHYNLPQHVAGATLMAVGSSAPELFISIIALLRPGGHEAIGMGTIVGSAIFNMLFIVGASAYIHFTVVSWKPIIRDISFYALSVFILIFAFQDGQIVVHEALFFIILYLAYLFVVIKFKNLAPPDSGKIEEPRKFRHKSVVFFSSIFAIAILSWVLVESAIGIAEILQIPESIVALTVLAIGTSVPDSLSSIIVSRQGRGDMAITNAIGSNVFDILFGLGMPWLLSLLFLTDNIPVKTANILPSTMLLFTSILIVLFLLLFRRWKIGKYSGIFLILIYIFYLTWAIIQT